MNALSTVLIALFVPIAWGLASAWLFDRIRLRRECKLRDDKVSQG